MNRILLPLAAVIALLVLALGWSMLRARTSPSTPTAKGAAVYSRLRDQILRASPEELGIEVGPGSPTVWGVLMESGYGAVPVTLVALKDGNASLYFGTGGGVIGGHAHASVRRVAGEMVQVAQRHLPAMTLSDSFPLPAAGRVRFYVLTNTGTFTSEAGEQVLVDGRGELSPLFHAGQRVVTELRNISESGEPR